MNFKHFALFSFTPTLTFHSLHIFWLRGPIFRLRSSIFRLRSPILRLRSPILRLRSPIFRLRSPSLWLRSPILRRCTPPSWTSFPRILRSNLKNWRCRHPILKGSSKFQQFHRSFFQYQWWRLQGNSRAGWINSWRFRIFVGFTITWGWQYIVFPLYFNFCIQLNNAFFSSIVAF